VKEFLDNGREVRQGMNGGQGGGCDGLRSR
jgi:hypothetical protein